MGGKSTSSLFSFGSLSLYCWPGPMVLAGITRIIGTTRSQNVLHRSKRACTAFTGARIAPIKKKCSVRHFATFRIQECAIKGSPHELTPECKAVGVKLFPSWQFGNNPPKEGVLSLQELGDKTGCSLP